MHKLDIAGHNYVWYVKIFLFYFFFSVFWLWQGDFLINKLIFHRPWNCAQNCCVFSVSLVMTSNILQKDVLVFNYELKIFFKWKKLRKLFQRNLCLDFNYIKLYKRLKQQTLFLLNKISSFACLWIMVFSFLRRWCHPLTRRIKIISPVLLYLCENPNI